MHTGKAPRMISVHWEPSFANGAILSQKFSTRRRVWVFHIQIDVNPVYTAQSTICAFNDIPNLDRTTTKKCLTKRPLRGG
jgi:hypothetical protein